MCAAVCWLLAAYSARADSYPRQAGIDALHYTFRVSLSDQNDEISAEADVELRFLRDNVTQVYLDFAAVREGKGMAVTDLSCGPDPCSFKHSGERLEIRLAAAPAVGERRTIHIAYHGQPANGLHIGKSKFGDRTFFSWNWPTMARQWLPTIDHPSDKATSEFLITAPAKYQVVANGRLEEERDLGDGRRLTHWKESVPIASWLNNIGVAQFVSRHFAQVGGIPVQTWVFPQDRENGIATFETPTRQATGVLHHAHRSLPV